MTHLDDLVLLTVLAGVVDAQSFTTAEKLLGLSRSVVSPRVAVLERRIGVTLR